MSKRYLLVAMACGLTSPALAQSQSSMNGAAGRGAQAADRTLNEQYRVTMARLSPASRSLLRDAQRSWIGFRDQQCKFEASGVRGGSAYPMVYGGCMARLSQDRTRQLKAAQQCQEGDLACPR